MTVTIEEVKKFWNDRPCNVKHSKKEIGTKEYFDEVSRKKFIAEPHIIPFSKFSKWNEKKVLEIGCGLGTVGINFATYGAEYTGVELSEESMKLAQKRFDVYEQSGKFYCGNAEELSSFVPVQTYDFLSIEKLFLVMKSTSDLNVLGLTYSPNYTFYIQRCTYKLGG